ncbi:PRSS12, partial [Symbiodinium necroappetens]
EKSWLEKPRGIHELDALMPTGWVPVRRFPVVQRGKLRPIDDLTESGTNGACGTLDKLDLRALDETVFTAMLILKCLKVGSFALKLGDGRVLRGRVHPYWLQRPEELTALRNSVEKSVKAVLDMLGFAWAKDKDEAFLDQADLLGLRMAISSGLEAAVTLSNKPARVDELSRALSKVLEDGVIRPRDAATVFGRLQFAESQLLGRAGRLALADIRWIERSSSDVHLNDFDRNVFSMLGARRADRHLA